MYCRNRSASETFLTMIMLISRDSPVTVHHTRTRRAQEGTEALSKTVTGKQAVEFASSLFPLGPAHAQEQGVTAI